MRIRTTVSLLLAACWLSACVGTALLEAPTSVPATPTLQATPSPSPTATSQPPVPRAITPDNASKVEAWYTLGYGSADQVEWAPDDRQFAVITPQGVYVYDALQYQEIAFFAVDSPKSNALASAVSVINFSADSQLIAAGLGNGGVE